MPISVFESKSLMLLSNKDFALQLYRGRKEQKNILEMEQDINVLHPAGHARLSQAATKIFIEFNSNHYVVTSILASQRALYVLMYVVTTLITLPECVHQLASLHQ